MPSAAWRHWCPSNSLPPTLGFLCPLTPPILISEGSCNKNQETIEAHLDSFYANSLTDTDSRYSTFDRKLLAAQAAIKHFHHFCKGRAFPLWTDHKLLVTAISRVSAPILPRQQCHLVLISELNVQLLYLPGLKNVIANFLSRPTPPVDQSSLQRRQIQWIS
jgi:hypothetical protein